jgi:hypothetical protein
MALKGLMKAPLRVAYEVGAIALEVLRIPLRLWLRAAEIATRRGRYALLLVPLAAAGVAIAIAVDSPKGRETGQAGIAYQGARAMLLEGYKAEIAAACALGVAGLLLAVYPPAAARRRLGRRPARQPVRAAGGRRVRSADPGRASG